MTPSGVLETVLYAEDLDAAQDFYTSVLGLELLWREDNRHLFFRCGHGVFLIFNPCETVTAKGSIPVPPHGAHGPGHVCFRASVEELSSWRQHLDLHNVDIESDFEWPQGGSSIYFRDPAGNSIEFAEPRIWGLT